MTDSIRAEIEVGVPGNCPVARASSATGNSIDRVTRSSEPDASGRLAEEFRIEGGTDGEHESAGDASIDLPDGERVFDFESHTVYRFTRDPDAECVCECIERVGWPVSDVRASDGSLFVSCYASDVESLGEVVTDLRQRFDGIRVRRLIRSGGAADGEFLVLDRSPLTDRQREVLETAHEMGYFDYPKGANAGEVAEEIGIARSTFSEHLAAAQGKLLDALLDD